MRLKHIDIQGFKSFAKKSTLSFDTAVTAVVGPNGSGKSNVVEAFRFVLGEQSMKSMRGKTGADLIFRGSNNMARLSRALVSITFDNSDKIFAFQHTDETGKTPLFFDTITFTRELFADGTSKYLMNGTDMRLKQMIEVLSSVNIGASSHHIISQGEADSILRASTKDRREMLEEALGLKIYHYRIKESESKLAKSSDTLKEVQALRRELIPHLKFLSAQVQKIEKGRSIRTEFEGVLLEYLANEQQYLKDEESKLYEAMNFVEHKKSALEQTLAELPLQMTIMGAQNESISHTKKILQEFYDSRRTLEGRIGRLEGIIEVERRLVTAAHSSQGEGTTISFAPTEYTQLLDDIEFFIRAIKNASTLDMVKEAIGHIDSLLASLKARQPQIIVKEKLSLQHSDNLKESALELEVLQRELRALVKGEESAQSKLHQLELTHEEEQRVQQSATTIRYETLGELTTCNAELSILTSKKELYTERKAYFDTELREAAFLFGPQFLHQLKQVQVGPGLVENLHTMKRNIDRLKIRLEEHSGIGNEVVAEYESTVERDVFLAREIADIEASIRNLESLIIDLKKVLDDKFTTGIMIINERFGEFFKTMFGGGSAFLEVILEKKRKRKNDEELSVEEQIPDEDEGRFMERGIEVHVNLPEKKVKELTMLSGGERSLVSIALLFAISQVNPPPFLVLDETDAALDEANSRRYGDMVERLSVYSQLIVVTHNRETMSRASVLYGVTLGSDGASKLLSIKFDDVVKVAK